MELLNKLKAFWNAHKCTISFLLGSACALFIAQWWIDRQIDIAVKVGAIVYNKTVYLITLKP